MLTRQPMILWRGPRKPLAGVALVAMAGIGLAEGWHAAFLTGHAGAANAPWVMAGLFFGLFALWRWRRWQWTFWGTVAAGYAALHLFGSDPVAAQALARRLARPATVQLDEAHGEFHRLRATGTVLDAPRASSRDDRGTTWRCTLALAAATVDTDPVPSQSDPVPVAVEWRDGPRVLAAGDRLDLRAALARNVPGPRNPGEFDLAAYRRRQGVLSELRIGGVADARVLARAFGFGWPVVTMLAGRFHDWMEDRLCLDLRDDPEVCAVVSTTLLGLRGPPGLGDLEGPFQRTGTLHYFAVDGLKLGLLSFLLLRVITSLGVRRPWSGLPVLPLLVAYALATGLGAASARAVLVAAIFVGGELLDRPPRPLNSLGAAAAILLLFDTQQLFALSFQLSFLVVLAILLLTGPLTRRIERIGSPDPFLPYRLYSRPLRAWEWLRRRVCELTAVAIAAWIGSAPLMLLNFHLVSPISPLANVLVFPLAFATLALDVCSLAGAPFFSLWTVWINNANWLVAKGLLLAVHGFDLIPGGSFAVASPEHWRREAPALETVVFDLGPARSVFVRAGSHAWLVDAARPAEYHRDVLTCLNARAVGRLDGLLLTQGDADHLAAAQLALADLHPEQLVVDAGWSARSPTARTLRRLLAEGKHAGIACQRGDTIPLAPGVSTRVLYPPDEDDPDSDIPARAAPDRALVLRTEAAGWRVLTLSEGDGTASRWLLAHEPPAALASAVLITAAPVSAELLAAVRPRLLVLQPPARGKGAKNTGASPPLPVALASTAVIVSQQESGAVTLRLYPDRLEGEGFVDGKTWRLPKLLP